MKSFPTVRLGNLTLHAITEDQCIARVLQELDAGRGGFVVTPNLDHVRRLRHDGGFAEIYRSADIIVPDGMPLIWASWLQGTRLPQRVAGSSLISTLSAEAARRRRSVFLLGGTPGTADTAAKVLQERYEGLQIAGTFCPAMGFENDEGALAEVIRSLREAQPDIIYVGLGAPKQERLIFKLRPQLPNSWWLGIGVSFSFLAGEVRRAPRWMQQIGLEWLHRLYQEPRRLTRRYLVEDLPFAFRLFGESIGTRFRASN